MFIYIKTVFYNLANIVLRAYKWQVSCASISSSLCGRVPSQRGILPCIYFLRGYSVPRAGCWRIVVSQTSIQGAGRGCKNWLLKDMQSYPRRQGMRGHSTVGDQRNRIKDMGLRDNIVCEGLQVLKGHAVKRRGWRLGQNLAMRTLLRAWAPEGDHWGVKSGELHIQLCMRQLGTILRREISDFKEGGQAWGQARDDDGLS